MEVQTGHATRQTGKGHDGSGNYFSTFLALDHRDAQQGYTEGPMKILPIFFLMLSTCPAIAGAQSSLEGQLGKEYIGSERILRHFYADDTLKFDATGNPLNHEKTGAWTLLGAVVIDRIKLSPARLELKGHRNIVTIDDATKKLKRINGHEKVRLEIAVQAGPQESAQLHAALAKVFVAPGDGLVAALPDYWQDYMARFFGKPGHEEPCQGSETAPREAGKVPASSSGTPAAPLKVSSGVMEGNLVNPVAPNYLLVARQAGIEGEINMRARISKTGEVVGVCLTRVVGGGLDDEAVHTVRQWKYRPYLLNGKPIEVNTTYTFKFHTQ
jgi:TonB family protein